MGKDSTVELTIDRKKVTAEAEATILEAARAAGMHIPTLCYHAHLSPIGSCRVCLVEVDGATDPVASCVTRVRDGMIVKTDSARIRAMRKAMVELVLVDHPLECPVCDKAGECELQDIVFELGITEPQYAPVGAVREINEINRFIGRYPNRCILCGRCVRACEEIEGASVMSYVQRHGYSGEIACVSRDTIECEQCGQCLRVCPVGALIGQDFKYRARAWELAKTETTCPHCGVGCTLTLNTKQGKIMRVTSESAAGTNGNLCVRGRFGVDFVHSDRRVAEPMIRKGDKLVQAGWGEALDLVSKKLGEAKEQAGAEAMAVLGSSHNTNEENYQLQKVARCVLGTNNIDFSDRAVHADTLSGVADVLGVATAATNSLAETAHCDAILVIDADVSEMNPMFSLHIQRAVRERGAKLIVMDARRTKLARFATMWLPVAAGSESVVLGAIVRRICEAANGKSGAPQGMDEMIASLDSCTLEEAASASGVDGESMAAAADLFAAARAGAVIVAGWAGCDMGRLAADLGVVTSNVGDSGGVYVAGLASNWQGALDVGVAPSVLPGGVDVSDAGARDRLGEVWGCEIPQCEGLDLGGVLEAAAAGKIKAAYVMGDDPSATHPGAVEAFKNVDFLVVQDAVDGPLTEIADVVLPGLSFAEKRGTFTSMERAIQRVRPALKPQGGARRDLEILSELADRMGSTLESGAATVMEEIALVNPSYSHVSYEALEDGAMRWPASDSQPRGAASFSDGGFPSGYPTLAPVSAAPAALSVDENEMRILTGQRRFHSGHLSRMAKGLTEAYAEPLAEVSPQDAERLGVKDGMIVKLASSKGEVKAKVKVTGKSLPGTVFLPFGFAEASAAELLGWNGEARIVKAGVSVEKA